MAMRRHAARSATSRHMCRPAMRGHIVEFFGTLSSGTNHAIGCSSTTAIGLLGVLGSRCTTSSLENLDALDLKDARALLHDPAWLMAADGAFSSLTGSQAPAA